MTTTTEQIITTTHRTVLRATISDETVATLTITVDAKRPDKERSRVWEIRDGRKPSIYLSDEEAVELWRMIHELATAPLLPRADVEQNVSLRSGSETATADGQE